MATSESRGSQCTRGRGPNNKTSKSLNHSADAQKHRQTGAQGAPTCQLLASARARRVTCFLSNDHPGLAASHLIAFLRSGATLPDSFRPLDCVCAHVYGFASKTSWHIAHIHDSMENQAQAIGLSTKVCGRVCVCVCVCVYVCVGGAYFTSGGW